MDQLQKFLEAVKTQGAHQGRFRGLLHILIGRRIGLSDGTVVSAGMTWRDAALRLKKARWGRADVGEMGMSLKDLPPRDREKFWYAVISRAAVVSPQASADADALVEPLRALGYEIGPPPGA